MQRHLLLAPGFRRGFFVADRRLAPRCHLSLILDDVVADSQELFHSHSSLGSVHLRMDNPNILDAVLSTTGNRYNVVERCGLRGQFSATDGTSVAM